MSDDPSDHMPIVDDLEQGRALGGTFGIYGEEDMFGDYDENVFRVYTVHADGTLEMTHHSDHWGVPAWGEEYVNACG